MPTPGRASSAGKGPSGMKREKEDHPWTRLVPDHPDRTDSPTYVASRTLMNKLVRSLTGFLYETKDVTDKAGKKHYEDHHGGGLWLKDDQGWFLVRNLCGIEWSAQFCAEPAKVDKLRQVARRIYARFPEAAAELKIQPLLDKPIKTAADVARWTDSICNASVPFAEDEHRGVLPKAGGIHHYPTPVAEIAFFKYDDFQLWVTDDQGAPAVVVPVGKRGSGDGRTRVIAAEPGSEMHKQLKAAWPKGRAVVLPADHRLSEEAFGEQYHKLLLTPEAVPPDDPLSKAKVNVG
jgi:hypothetical protein